MYKYEIDLGSEWIDLDEMMGILKGDGCYAAKGKDLRSEIVYEFGQAGYKFIVEALQKQVDNIKAQQPSE